jgi:ADP-ribosylglycohydrolase
MDTKSLHSRIYGCLIAGAVGDALGAGVEFSSLAGIKDRWGADGVVGYVPAYGTVGAITDDTQLTLLTIEAIRRALTTGGSVLAATFPLYQGWAYAQQHDGHLPEGADAFLDKPMLVARRAPGNACLISLASDTMGTVQSRVKLASKGCGTVMRAAPFGLIPIWSAEESYRHAVENAALTHGHDTALAASGAMAMIVRRMLSGSTLRQSVESTIDWLTADQALNTAETSHAQQEALRATVSARPTPLTVEALGGGWVAEEALAIAVYCALVHEDDARRALLLAVNHGGDSDSTAAITGNLMGVAHGLTGVPSDWVTDNEATALIGDMVEALLSGMP